MGARLWPDILPIGSHALLLLSSGFPKRASGLNSRVPLTVVKQTPELDHATSKTDPTPTSVTAVLQPQVASRNRRDLLVARYVARQVRLRLACAGLAWPIGHFAHFRPT